MSSIPRQCHGLIFLLFFVRHNSSGHISKDTLIMTGVMTHLRQNRLGIFAVTLMQEAVSTTDRL